MSEISRKDSSKSEKAISSLGDYITLCRRKNKNLESTKLVGVSSKKELLFAQYQLEYEDPAQYLVLKGGQFIVDLVSVARVNKLPVALNSEKESFLVSNIYQVFEVSNPCLLKEYLMLLFRNSVIDQQSIFWAGSGVRGFLTWTNFCKLQIFVPPLDFQKRVVYKYQIVEKLIKVKRKVNELLEKWMQAYYHILFDNLTEYESSIKVIKDLFSIFSGWRPPKYNKELETKYFCKEGGIPWLQVSDISKKKCKFVSETSEQLTEAGFRRCGAKLIPAVSLNSRGGHLLLASTASKHNIGKLMINVKELSIDRNLWIAKQNKNLGIPFSYFFLENNVQQFRRLNAHSTSLQFLKLKKFLILQIELPPYSLINKFNSFCKPIFELQKQNEQTITKLERMQKCWIESLE